jgi:hypothetical protein
MLTVKLPQGPAAITPVIFRKFFYYPHHMTPPRIELPSELRVRVLTALENLEHQASAVRDRRAQADAEIRKEESAVAELAERIGDLERKALSSDAAAAELIQCERRAGLIRDHLDRLRADREKQPSLDFREIEACRTQVLLHWEFAIESAAQEVFAVFGLESHLRPMFIANLNPLMRIRLMRNNYYPPASATVGVLKSALAGNFDLSIPAAELRKRDPQP